jgi:O-antigen ligase
MLAAFKEDLLPYLVYLLLWATCLVALTRRANLAVQVFAVLCALPMLWYPVQAFPLGSWTLSLLVLFALVGSWWRRREEDIPAPTGSLIWLLLLSSYLSVWNVSLRYGLPVPLTLDNTVLAYWKNYAMMLALYFVAYHGLRDRGDVRHMVMVVYAVLLVMAWREVANFVAGETFSDGHRANGPFWILGMNANHFGAFIAHFATFALGVSVLDPVPWRKWLGRIVFGCSLYPLFYSYSRGAYAAVLVAVLMLGLLRHRLLFVATLVVMVFWQDLLPDSVVDRIQMTESSDGQVEESAAMRLVMWNFAKTLFADHPIFGIGFGGFSFASDGMPLRNVHNYFLQTGAEQGVVGLLLLALLLGKALHCGWRLYKQQEDGFFSAVGLGFMACTVAVIITNQFGDRFSQLEMGAYFWLLLGTVDRAWVLSQQQRSTSSAAQEPVPDDRPGASGARGHPTAAKISS